MIEHKIIREESSAGALNPNNGNLERTLDTEAQDGWRLLSYDWTSWRTAIFVRSMSTCEHGGLIDADGTVSCQLCDWCPICKKVTHYEGETCTVCGRQWGTT